MMPLSQPLCLQGSAWAEARSTWLRASGQFSASIWIAYQKGCSMVSSDICCGVSQIETACAEKDTIRLQLIICVVFFIALLSVLGSRMPAAWDFNIEGVSVLKVLHYVCPRCAYGPPFPYTTRLRTLWNFTPCINILILHSNCSCSKVSSAIARVCSKILACLFQLDMFLMDAAWCVQDPARYLFSHSRPHTKPVLWWAARSLQMAT